ncbi:unnamed protein product [Durusdinium trenchii]|uniref:Uncharacterized protein n=2 Tax=Durusdinium trenchii TaxID=1381693 RepID=A0ABP0NQB6_9DINO
MSRIDSIRITPIRSPVLPRGMCHVCRVSPGEKWQVDNIHCGSFYIPVYFLSVGLMQSDSLQASKENLMAEWWTTYVTCTGFWVPFMCANWRFCPAAHRVKAMQTANLFWNVIIDHLAHREEVHEHAHHEE